MVRFDVWEFSTVTITTSALFTTQGAALETGLSTRRIGQLANAGKLPSISLRGPCANGPQRVYRLEDLQQLMRSRAARARKAPGAK